MTQVPSGRGTVSHLPGAAPRLPHAFGMAGASFVGAARRQAQDCPRGEEHPGGIALVMMLEAAKAATRKMVRGQLDWRLALIGILLRMADMTPCPEASSRSTCRPRPGLPRWTAPGTLTIALIYMAMLHVLVVAASSSSGKAGVRLPLSLVQFFQLISCDAGLFQQASQECTFCALPALSVPVPRQPAVRAWS